jgi:hypothetical protein
LSFDDLAIASLPQLLPLFWLVGYFCRAGLVTPKLESSNSDRLVGKFQIDISSSGTIKEVEKERATKPSRPIIF